jgi:hypothetical protein
MSKLYIFCFWLIIWVLLFKFGFVELSPYPLTVIATVFTFFLVLFANKIPIQTALFVIFWHILLVFFLEEKWDKYTIALNLMVFIFYLCCINMNNETMYTVYKKVYNRLNNEKMTISRYLYLNKINNLNLF